MKEEKKDIIYTAEDIKRYLIGAMMPAEMHAMEMAALDDPLLAEAMDGYELMEQKDWGKELAALRGLLNKEEEKRIAPPVVKINTFKWWKAAAAIVVLGITAGTAYIFTNKNKTETAQEIVKSETVVAKDSNAVSVNADSANSFLNSQAADTISQLIAKVDNARVNSGTVSVITQSNRIEMESTAISDSLSVYKPSLNDYAVNEKRDDNEKANNLKEEVASAPAAAKNEVVVNADAVKKSSDVEAIFSEGKARKGFANRENNFAGVVLSPGNMPIGYASVTVAPGKKAVYTDANGAFHFKAADSTVNVTVSSAGYSSQKFTLQNDAGQNKLILRQQDVVTQSIGAGRKKDAAKMPQPVIDSSALDAEPSGGWVEYNNYLSDNLQLPGEAKQKNIHGEVELTLKLKENGDISTVKVAKPLCDECDAEAVRLVKEGPKWEVKGNKKTKAKVKVKF